MPSSKSTSSEIIVRPLLEKDLPAADRVFRLAFGTLLGLPDPMAFSGDASYIKTRWLADPDAAFAAEQGGELVGSNFATRWGSVGLFGPLTVLPELWDQGVGKRLMAPILECFDRWGIRHAGLFTVPQSPKHIGLYQKFGFWPRFLTAVMAKTVETPKTKAVWGKYSELSGKDKEAFLRECKALTGAIQPGLDVEREVRAVDTHQLGETIILREGEKLTGVAICHCGGGTETGGDTCFVKFGAADPQPAAGDVFGKLIDACESLAAERGLSRLIAGVNTSRHEAYRHLLERGFRTFVQGVAMQKPNEPGYNRPGVYVVDDWR